MRRLLTTLFVFAASPLAAHDTWLQAGPRARSANAPLVFHLTSGGAFPLPEHAVAADRMTVGRVRARDRVITLRAQGARRQARVLQAPAPGPGLVTAWVSLKPRTLELTPALLDEYLKEIGEADTVGPRWARVPEPKTWRETYRKHAKTFSIAGADPGDLSWRLPVGLSLEIVPETSPVGLAAGSDLAVRVLQDGAPVAGLPLRAARSGDAGTIVRTDAAGRATFTLDAPGAWLVAGTALRESAVRPGEWESDFTTLTVEVAPAP